MGVSDPLRISFKSSRLLERVGEKERYGGVEDPRLMEEWKPPRRGEMPEGMDRSSSISDAECERGRSSMTPPPPTKTEGEGERWSRVKPGPVKKQNL